MKTIIIYASTHHGNTKRVIDSIVHAFDVELIDATKIHEKDLSGYDLIGFASGIFFSNFHEKVLNFARVNLIPNKDVFFIATAGKPIDFNFHSIIEVIRDKNCNEIGRFQCKGFDTYGPFKIFGGIQKGHPDEKELKAAVDFYRAIFGKGNHSENM